MDGSIVFARLRQCAPHVTHGSLGHRSPQPKKHLDWFSHFCTAHDKVLSGMPGYVFFPKNCPFAWGNLDSHLRHGSLGQPKSKSQTASRLVQPFFLHSSPQSVSIFYNGPPLLPSKLPIPIGGSGYLGPPESSTQTTSRSVVPLLQSSLV